MYDSYSDTDTDTINLVLCYVCNKNICDKCVDNGYKIDYITFCASCELDENVKQWKPLIN